MPVTKLVSTPDEAFRAMRRRMKADLKPIWVLINHTDHTPFWLLARELFPIAESIGFLLYGKTSTVENLTMVIDENLVTVSRAYENKGAMIAQLYRHSLIHQDEPRSLFAKGITAQWRLSIGDGTSHLQRLAKNTRSKSFVLSFDLHQFYDDIAELLVVLEKNGPKRNIVRRYNSWTFKNISNDKRSQEAVQQIKSFYEVA